MFVILTCLFFPGISTYTRKNKLILKKSSLFPQCHCLSFMKPYNMYIYNADHSLEISPSQVNPQAPNFTTATPGTSWSSPSSTPTSLGLWSCKWTDAVDKTRLPRQFSGISKSSLSIVSRVILSLLIVKAFIPMK